MIELGKAIYKSDDVPILDYLMTYRAELTKEFLDYHTDWEGDLANVILSRPGGKNVDYMLSDPNAWKAQPLRHEYSPDGEYWENTEQFCHFPTAVKIMEEFKGDIGIVFYSILEANSIISRHTGPENRSGKYLRIHIPLIVPEGDIFLEVNGEEVTWDEPFGFNNQLVHSAYNYSPYRRLVFLIDIDRARLGLPPGRPWSIRLEKEATPFIRKNKQTP